MKTLSRKSADSGREQRVFALQLKAVGEDGAIEGYGSVAGVKDYYDDVIANGAFAVTLAAHKEAGTLPAMLWQHDSDHPCGVWLEMREDDNGLYVRGRLALETVKGKEAYALLKMGALNGLSIGFCAKEWTYNQDTDIRTLTEIDLWEVSIVTFAANPAAKITHVKAVDEIEAPKTAERILRDAGFSKADATAFVSRVMRMGEERSESAKSTAEAVEAINRLRSSFQSA